MKTIPYGHQWIDSSDIKEVIKILKSDFITQGPKIEEFENALCKYTRSKYAVAVSSGTAALHVACLAAGITSGDEVITSPITFVASANCVLYCGGKPVFADVQKGTINISPMEIEKKITKKTKAIIPVDFAGHPSDLQEIYTIAKKHNLLVVEDACHALGAKYKNSKIGSCKYSDMTVLSFHPVKHITTGEGGAVLTNNKKLYEKMLMFRNHGIIKSSFINKHEGRWYYEMQCLGFNYRITDIQSALGISQLKKLDKFVRRRRAIAEFYSEAFKDNEYFEIPVEKQNALSSYHLYFIRLKDKYISKRNKIFLKMRENGLGAQVHYIPVYWQPYYESLGFKRGICPVAEDYYRRTISIPMFPSLKKEEISCVINKTIKIFNGI